MRFLDYLPNEFKETVKIIRINAVTNEDIDVASDVECWIEPDGSVGGNQIVVEDGVPILYLLYTMHLAEPIPNVIEGDLVQRSGGDELRIASKRPYGKDVMQLILRDRKVL